MYVPEVYTAAAECRHAELCGTAATESTYLLTTPSEVSPKSKSRMPWSTRLISTSLPMRAMEQLLDCVRSGAACSPSPGLTGPAAAALQSTRTGQAGVNEGV